ncbi:MAG: PilX N-terminal domain-containing pilus assembly protein [Vicinamibacterales bacterium]
MSTSSLSCRRAHLRSERGVAIILALFMMLGLSIMGASLMLVSQTETQSSHNYRLMSQARYGAESGVHKAINFLLNSYTPPVALNEFVTTVSPVTTIDGDPVVLSWDASQASYPVQAVKDGFAAAAQGSLDVGDAPVTFRATARLKSMRQINDAFTGTPITLQTWEITGEGHIGGVRDAIVEVASTLERQTTPIYSYAAFATDNGCAALSFAGGARTDSFDSSDPSRVNGRPPTFADTGNVGTNGNLTEVGNPTVINGSLSTPRTGVGACGVNNVTALTQSGGATLVEGVTQLSQPLVFPTPPQPDPLPPTTNVGFTQNGGCPAGVSGCTAISGGAMLDPNYAGNPTPGSITMGNVTTNGNSTVRLKAGTYIVNSVTMNGNSKIIVESAPVIIKVAGVGQSTPITITGQGLVNMSFRPDELQFIYGGTGEVKLAGGDNTAALFYAPNATSLIAGGADLWGAIVVRRLTETGGAAIHYDKRLATSSMTAGNYMLSAFTWKNY